MRIDLGRSDAERAVIESILRDADDRDVLNMLRNETTVLVLMVRVANDEKRKTYELEQQQGEE